MDWHELSANWDTMVTRLQSRFPKIDRSALSEPPRDRRVFTHHLADMHDLSKDEAHAALDEFMRVQDLARRAPELTSE